MRKWIPRTLLAGLAVVLATVLLVKWLWREPEYQGRALSDWVADLPSSDPAVRREAVAALNALGPEAIPYLTAELSGTPSTFQWGAESLAKRLPDRLKTPLRRLYSPASATLRKHAAVHALSVMGTNAASAVPVLEEVLREPHVGLSSAAASALVEMGTNALPVLIAALDDGDYNIRSSACQAIAAFRANAAPAVPRLARIVTDERGPIASIAGATLARIGEPAVPVLIGFLASTNQSVRYRGAFTLAQIGPWAHSAVPALIQAATDPDEEVRQWAVLALKQADARSPEVSQAFLRALEDPAFMVRSSALIALTLRPRVVRAHFEEVLTLIEDESPQVRANAALALGQTAEHGTEAVPHLRRLTADTNATVSANAARALATITNAVQFTRTSRD